MENTTKKTKATYFEELRELVFPTRKCRMNI